MKFGDIPVGCAKGALLAHSLALPEKRFSKAHCLSDDDIAILVRNGIQSICVAQLDVDDLDEDQAAQAIASFIHTSGIDTKPPAAGRVNFHAAASGLFDADAALINAINAVDPAITIATLAQHTPVEAGQLVATIKIIPYAVQARKAGAIAKLCAQKEAFRVHPFSAKKVGLIQSLKPGLKTSVLDKTTRVTQARLEPSSSVICRELRVAHEVEAVRHAILSLLGEADLIVIYGAWAMADFDDVIPAAIRQAGGEVIRAGMPVDPGNLLVLGRLGDIFVIGAPGCSRAPKENGFDWVLDRLLAGIDISASDIAGWGVGGLLKEISSRPQPRES